MSGFFGFVRERRALCALAALAVFVQLAFRALCHVRPLMNALTQGLTTPLRALLGRVTYLVPFSVMEITLVLAIIAGAAFVAAAALFVIRGRGERLRRLFTALLAAFTIVLSLYNLFWLLWGVNFWADGFQERSGVYGQKSSPEDLRRLTAYFAGKLAETADAVARDERGVFAVPREQILSESRDVYTGLEESLPFMTFEDTGVKPMAFSHLMSMIDFTGFYCSWTGEANVNVEAPACLLPVTAAHELSHQRGIASEQECNFLGILAATESDCPDYVYSGWLSAFIYAGNAYYSCDTEGYRAIYETLPDGAKIDLYDNSLYWAQFQDAAPAKVSNAVYDGVIKAYGDERGIRSYGACVDLLAAWYGEAAAGS